MEHHLRPPAPEGLAQLGQVLDVADQPTSASCGKRSLMSCSMLYM